MRALALSFTASLGLSQTLAPALCPALGLSGVAMLSGTAHASEQDAWFVGEWKTPEQDGMSIAVRFGSNGKGVFGIYQNGEPAQSFNIAYTRSGDQLVFTRNGVDVRFELDEAARVLKTGGGVAMVRISSEPEGSGGCEEACWAAAASEKALREKYGSTTVPTRFQYAVPLAEGPGYAAYEACAKPYGMKAFTDPVIAGKCEAASQKACVSACEKRR